MLIALCVLSLFTGTGPSAPDYPETPKGPNGSPERLYVDMDSVSTFENTFHIHQGNNIWIETNSIHNDGTGFYTYYSEIKHDDDDLNEEFAKFWKCPYCFYVWPQDVFPCQNSECPSVKNKR